MTEQERDVVLNNIMSAVAELVDRVRNKKAIGEFTEEQFTEVLLKATDTKQYIAAKREEEISQRIFADVDGVIQVFQPFRVGNARAALKLFEMMKNYFSNPTTTQFVVAMAIVKDDGTYEKAPTS
jgi:hypothetical protein